MTAPVRPVAPGLRAVVVEELRFVGLSLGRAAATGGVVLLALLVLAVVRPGTTLSYGRELGVWFAVLGLLAPLAVWRGRDADLWALPVEHRRLALARVAAGWCWLMAAAGALLLWMVVAILLTGGSFGTQGLRTVLAPDAAGAGAVDPRLVSTVAWRTPGWLWLAPFGGATVAYLLGSAVVLGSGRVRRWLGALALALLLAPLLGVGAPLAGLSAHPYGPETVVAGGTLRRASAEVQLTTGETVRVWRDLPTPGRWAAATLLWTGAGAAALWLATLRLRERERRAPARDPRA